MSSFQATVLFWRSSSCVLTFSDHRPFSVSSLFFVLRRQSRTGADRNQALEDKLLLTSCCAPSSHHCQWKTDVDGDRKRQSSIRSSRRTSRQELWERAQFDMRISFCKQLEQSVSGCWHHGVLHSHIFTDKAWINGTKCIIGFEYFEYRLQTHDICLAVLDKVVLIKFSKLVYIHMRSLLNYWLGEKCEVGVFVYLSQRKGVSCLNSSRCRFDCSVCLRLLSLTLSTSSSVWVSARWSQMESDPWQAAPY